MTTATKPDAEKDQTAAPSLSLDERIMAVMMAVHVKATGKAMFGTDKAISIGDVEDAVRGLLIEHKVHIRFRSRGLFRHDNNTWQANVTAVVRCSDRTARLVFEEEYADDWEDTGSTPAAAYSFARKSYMKALFHIADASDEGATREAPSSSGSSGNGAAVASASPSGNAPPAGAVAPPARRVSTGPVYRAIVRDEGGTPLACPECRQGALEYVIWDSGKSQLACDNWRNGCRYRAVPNKEVDTHMRQLAGDSAPRVSASDVPF